MKTQSDINRELFCCDGTADEKGAHLGEIDDTCAGIIAGRRVRRTPLRAGGLGLMDCLRENEGRIGRGIGEGG